MSDAKRQQVANQERAVAHLAMSIARLQIDMLQHTLSESTPDGVIQLRGEITARWMETLGDMLNGIDAADAEEARWLTPIFQRAQEMFPTP